MTYEVTIRGPETSALFDLKGRAQDIVSWAGASLPPMPQTPNTLSRSDAYVLMWIGREHWVIRAPLAEEEALHAALRPEAAPESISIVAVSDAVAFFRVTGSDAGEIMTVASPLDQHARVFPPDGASRTDVFGLAGLLLRAEAGFEIGIDRSHAAMLAECLARAIA